MIVIYSKPNCQYCEKAKLLLQSRNIDYVERMIGEDVSISWIMETFPGIKTAPIICEDKRLIGGYFQFLEAVADENFGKTLLLEGNMF